MLGRQSPASALKGLVVRLHSTGLSLRKTAAALEQFGVSRSHQAVWQWVHRLADSTPDPPTAKPSRVAVDETAVDVGTARHWLYAAIDVNTKLLLGVYLSERRGTDPAAVFLGQLARNTTSLRRRFPWTEWDI